MHPIRILCNTPTFNACGGIERLFTNYLRHFGPQVQMDFVTHDMNDEVLKDEVKEFGSRVYVLPPFSGRNLPNTLGILRSFFRKHGSRYDIFHCNMANAACFYFPFAKRAGISARILHSHQDKAADVPSHALRNTPLIRAGVPMATHRAACSRQAGDFLFPHRNYRIIPNAIDPERFAFDPRKREEFRRRYQLKDSVVIGNIGRLTEQKNQEWLLEVLRILYQEMHLDYQLVIVGEGHLLDALMAKAASLSLERRVVFCGSLADVSGALSAMDVFALPSLYEGLGIVNVEAQASGLPVIASDTVPEEAAMGDYYFPLPLASPRVWARKIAATSLLSEAERRDPIHRENIAARGYDLRTAAADLEEYYRSVLQSNPPRQSHRGMTVSS